MFTSPAAPCRALAIAACLLIAVQTTGVASEYSADAVEIPGPRELIDAGRFEEAFLMLQPLLLEETIEPNTMFLYGLAAVGAAQRAGRTEESAQAC